MAQPLLDCGPSFLNTSHEGNADPEKQMKHPGPTQPGRQAWRRYQDCSPGPDPRTQTGPGPPSSPGPTSVWAAPSCKQETDAWEGTYGALEMGHWKWYICSVNRSPEAGERC